MQTKNIKPHAVIMIPTYNEEDSIEKTLRALQSVFAMIQSHSMSILVFDSSSTDQTQLITRNLQLEYDNIYLQSEPEKSGLGSAYVKAIEYATNTLKADIVFQFDADGSHQPKYIPDMLAVLTKGADVVIGSRYVAGGSIPSNWARHRQLLSKMGNMVARLFLSRKYHDYTTGLRGIKVSSLQKVNLNKLLSKNYAHLLNLLWLLHKTGAKIEEFPIEFIDREQGYSKFPANNIIDSLRVVFLLRFFELKRYFSVVSVGAIGSVIQLILFNILRHFLTPEVANAFAIECAIISNFILNNYFSFSDRHFKLHKSITFFLRKFLRFNVFVLGSLIIQVGIVFIGSQWFGRGFLVENILVITGIVLASIMNYFSYTRLVWKKLP